VDRARVPAGSPVLAVIDAALANQKQLEKHTKRRRDAVIPPAVCCVDSLALRRQRGRVLRAHFCLRRVRSLLSRAFSLVVDCA
jgi:hypothetical protein